MAANVPQFTVRDALVACGVPDANPYQGQTSAQRMAIDIFNNDFNACIDKAASDLKDDFDAFSSLASNQGRIRLAPGVKKRVAAFVQWTKDEIRMDRDPATTPFPVNDVASLERRANSHKLFVTSAEMNSKAAKPRNFDSKSKWEEWNPTFRNYLRQIPGRNGVPLSYVIRENEQPNPMQTGDFLEDYVNNAPLHGEAYLMDRNQVATYLQSFIVDNLDAESKIQTLVDKSDGRIMFMALHENYSGVGLFANDITKAESIIRSLFYSGEKKPHMWWEEFKRQLLWAYATVDRHEGRQIYSNEQKLRELVKKIKADFLANQMSAITTELTRIPVNYTFEEALRTIGTVVQQKHPAPTSHDNSRQLRRNVRQVQQQGSRGGRGHGGHGRGGSGRGRGSLTRRNDRINSTTYPSRNQVPTTRTGSNPEKLKNGQWIEFHPAIYYQDNIRSQFPQSLQDKQQRLRAEYRSRRGGTNSIQELSVQVQELQSQLQQPPTDVNVPVPLGTVDPEVQSRISQVTTGTHGHTIMGGRAEQQRQRDSTPTPPGGLYDVNGRRISKLYSTSRRISQAAISPSSAPNTSANNEADTNADTCVLGKNFLLLNTSTHVASVYGFRGDNHEPDEIPIASGITAYDHPDGRTFLLVVHEALWYGSRMDHSLINPNQLRHNGIHFWDNPFDHERGLLIDIDDQHVIPLHAQGTKILFRSRVPTQEELQDERIPQIELTSMNAWDPHTVHLSQVSVSSKRPLPDIRTQLRHVSEISVQPTTLVLDPRSNDADLISVDPILTGLYDKVQISQVRYDPDLDDVPVRKTFISTDRHEKATAEALSERFGIGIHRARSTLQATLQRGTRSAILPLERRYRADRRFGKKRLHTTISTDTAYFPCRSLRGNVASQVYWEKCGFSSCYHASRANDRNIGPTLPAFSNDYGVPDRLKMDGAQIQVGRNTEFQAFIRANEIKLHISHPYRPNENPAEGGWREIKRRFYRFQQKYQVPMRLWDFLLDYTCEVMSITVNGSRYSQQRTPLEIITGITPDISEYLDFHFYEWVWFRTNAGLGPRELGRWLGISHRRGPLMTYWILPISCIPISCDSVQRVTRAELETEEVKQQTRQFTDAISPRLAPEAATVNVTNIPNHCLWDFENEEREFVEEFTRIIDDRNLPHVDHINEGTIDEPDNDHTPLDALRAPQHHAATPNTEGPWRSQQPDTYVGMSIGRKRDSEEPMRRATVKRRAVDADGIPLGQPHNTDNPLLDTRLYEVEYEDGETEILAANVLAENILAQVDEQGYQHLMIDEIMDHRTDPSAIPKSKGTYQTKFGATRKVHTTRGWELYVQWKDGSANWVALKDLKESYPVEIATYARNRGLLDEPAFAWWAPHAIKKKDRILSKVKSKYWDRHVKYGIRMPKSIADAKRLDAENGNTLWMDAVRKEMSAVMIALEHHEGDPRSLVGFEEITGHLVFDVKLGENFRRKARFCADGHKTGAPASLTYSSVVSRDSVRILLMIAALNNLELRAADIQNAFLTAPNREKCYIIAGDEFGDDKGKCFIVRRALYGLKSASASFRAFLAERLEEIGYKPSLADPDVWMRPAVKADGTLYYSYILAYVDDILCIDSDPDAVMARIGERFKFKNDEVAEPTSYLGAKVRKRQLDGTHIWTISPDDYVKAALKNVAEQLKGTKWRLPKKVNTPMTVGYHPELDGSPELGPEDRTRYLEFIGIIRWATEIGRVDVLHEVSILSQYQAAPREGHMEQILHIFAYWKFEEKVSIYLDPRLPNIDYSHFVSNRQDFQMHYRDAKEPLPDFMPKPRGMPVWITAYVDASHASNKKTRQSHTGYLIFINRAPILWFSKRQATVESSTFSSEFLALRSCVEAITHLRYKLRMFGIPLGGDNTNDTVDPAHIFCDNETVVKNSSLIESTLNKKHCSIAYHYVRWNVAAGVASIAWIASQLNLADAFTKILSHATRDNLFSQWVY